MQNPEAKGLLSDTGFMCSVDEVAWRIWQKRPWRRSRVPLLMAPKDRHRLTCGRARGAGKTTPAAPEFAASTPTSCRFPGLFSAPPSGTPASMQHSLPCLVTVTCHTCHLLQHSDLLPWPVSGANHVAFPLESGCHGWGELCAVHAVLACSAVLTGCLAVYRGGLIFFPGKVGPVCQ